MFCLPAVPGEALTGTSANSGYGSDSDQNPSYAGNGQNQSYNNNPEQNPNYGNNSNQNPGNNANQNSSYGGNNAEQNPTVDTTQTTSTETGRISTAETNQNPMAELAAFLRDHPEVAAELKSILAMRLEEQGSAIQAQEITDELLIRRLQSDIAFRAEAVRLMSDRGFITEEQAQRWNPTANNAINRSDIGALPGPQPSQRTGVAAGQRANRAQGARNTSNPVAEPVPLVPSTIPQRNPYPGLPSTADLYRQYQSENAPLRRFGADIFRPDVVGLTEYPMDLPAGADYVLGSGDDLVIDIWGGVSQQIQRVVDREGRISLPEAGPVTVSGMTLANAGKRIQSMLEPQFRGAKVDVSVKRVRTLRIYVVGDVQRPGAYDISSLSTPLNALYVAGGPTATGSMRIVRHYRGSQLVSEMDLYDLLLRGVRQSIEHLEPGDTILVPTVGPQVGIAGAVRRPAIYELKSKTDKLADVIEMAGGMTVASAPGEVKVERVEPHDQRVTLKVPLPLTQPEDGKAVDTSAFMVQDGDRVYVAAIDPYKNQTVYLQGHVYRPGSYPFIPGMKVTDLVKSYRDVLPEPAGHAEIVRLQPPDFRPVAISFDLTGALSGDDTITLQQFDTIRIFGRYDIDPPKVAIYGQVLRPGEYPMSTSMTASNLVKMAGGFNRSAYTDNATLASYVVENGQRVVTDQETIHIGAAVKGDAAADAHLKPGDVLTILQIPGWSDIGRSVSIKGEVLYPGSYGINEGERLSTFLRRVGGFLPTAYPAGIVLEREEVRKLEERGRQELINRVEATSSGVKISPNATGQDQAAILQAVQQQQQQAIATLRNQPVPGRLVVNISSNISDWANTPNDVTLRGGDVITIPKMPNFVLSLGQVYNANALTYRPGKTASWYLKQAGGPTQLANKKGIYVIRANGSVISSSGTTDFFSGGVLNTRMQPGDVLVVPEKFVSGSSAWKTTLETAQFVASLAIAAAAVAHL